MDICEYAEKVLGKPLLEYQKILLKQIDDYYKKHKELPNICFIPGRRMYGRTFTMEALGLKPYRKKKAKKEEHSE